MLDATQIAGLQSTRALEFALVKRRLFKGKTGEERAFLLRAALWELNNADLEPATKRERARMVTREAALSDYPDDLVECLAALSDDVRAGMVVHLDGNLQSRLYGHHHDTPHAPSAVATTKVNGLSDSNRVPPKAIPSTTSQMTSAVNSEQKLPEEDDSRGTVLLLSSQDNQRANVALLDENKFASYRVPDEQALNGYTLQSDICGFVVDCSFWAGWSATQRNNLISKLASYSTLACLLIDSTGVDDAGRFYSMVYDVRLRDARAQELLVRQGSTLTQADLACFAQSAEAIAAFETVQIIPADLSSTEVRAISAAAHDFYREKYSRTGKPLQSLHIRYLRQQTEPKVLLLTFNGSTVPVVAKITSNDPHESLRNEYDRFLTYIAPRDAQNQICLYKHSGCAVLLYRLVASPLDPNAPAPTLHDQLKSLWIDEIWNHCPELGTRGSHLVEAIGRVAEQLKGINCERLQVSSHESLAYLRGSALRLMTEHQVSWKLPGFSSGDIEFVIEKAQAIISTSPSALVHGDAHLENILMRYNSDACLIDYAYAGPGHPAFDLLRLESALCFKFMRPVDTEESFAAFQKAFSYDMLDEGALRRQFPDWFTTKINETIIQAMIVCRDCCYSVLEVHELGHEHYIAAKFLTTCCSLYVPDLQMGLIRATLTAAGHILFQPAMQ